MLVDDLALKTSVLLLVLASIAFYSETRAPPPDTAPVPWRPAVEPVRSGVVTPAPQTPADASGSSASSRGADARHSPRTPPSQSATPPPRSVAAPEPLAASPRPLTSSSPAPAAPRPAPASPATVSTPAEDEASARALQSVSVSTKDLDTWSENLRRLLTLHIADAILAPLDDNAAKLAEVRDMTGQPVFTQAQLDAFDMDRSSVLAMQLLVNNPQGLALLSYLLERRRQLREVISVDRRGQLFPAGYVLKRLRTLAASDLAGFRWAGGEEWEQRDFFSRGLPTDAEIVFRVCTHSLFDDAVRKDASRPGFAKEHVRESVNGARRPCIAATNSPGLPPHWWGLIDDGGQRGGMGDYMPHYKLVMAGHVFDVKGGRDNLFHCLVLFIYGLKSKGALGVGDLTSKVIRDRL